MEHVLGAVMTYVLMWVGVDYDVYSASLLLVFVAWQYIYVSESLQGHHNVTKVIEWCNNVLGAKGREAAGHGSSHA